MTRDFNLKKSGVTVLDARIIPGSGLCLCVFSTWRFRGIVRPDLSEG